MTSTGKSLNFEKLENSKFYGLLEEQILAPNIPISKFEISPDQNLVIFLLQTGDLGLVSIGINNQVTIFYLKRKTMQV